MAIKGIIYAASEEALKLEALQYGLNGLDVTLFTPVYDIDDAKALSGILAPTTLWAHAGFTTQKVDPVVEAWLTADYGPATTFDKVVNWRPENYVYPPARFRGRP